MADPVFCEDDLDEEKARRSILVTNVPENLTYKDVIIHFQKISNGGGEIDSVNHNPEDRSSVVITFEDSSTVETAIGRRQVLGKTEVTVHRYPLRTRTTEMFSLIIAKLDPSCLKVSVDELNQLLFQAQKKTKMNFVETCEGFLVTGTLDQINETCLFLSRFAKPRPSRPTRHKIGDEKPNDPRCNDQSDDKADSDLKPLELDVLPKLMTIIHNKVEAIERKFKMKIDWKLKEGKARLSPSGNDVKLFYQGKQEFISLYQKEFQDLKETNFALEGVDKSADLDGMLKDLMAEFFVVIEKTGEKNLHIFGKEDRVSQVKQRLQAKFGNRRQRRPPKGRDNGQLPRPDIFPPLSKTLDKGIVVSVHQGDITKVAVDVIVNAANERLVHGGGVAGAIVRQGGRQIQQESDDIIQQYGSVPVGQVVHTGPGDLPCKHIFHAVGPQWKVHGQEQSRQFIFQACTNSFYMASKQGMSSIALPEISSGVYGVSKCICAEMMFAAAESFSVEAPSDNQLKDIRFVNIDSPTYEAFRREFQIRYPKPEATYPDLNDNPGNTNVIFSSSFGTKMPIVSSTQQGHSRDKSSEGRILTKNANQQAMERDKERRKRAEAAARREEQGKKNEKAKDGGKLTKETIIKSRPNRGLLKGFREGGILKGPHEMKSKENSYTDDKHAFKAESKDKSVTRNGPKKEKEKQNKMKSMEKKEEKLNEKKEKEEEEEEEEEEEKEEEEEEDKKKVKKNTDRGEKKRKHRETVYQSKMHEETFKNDKQNGQQGLRKKNLGSTMKNEHGLLNTTESEVTDGKPEQKEYTSDETEGNENKYDTLANMLSDMKIDDEQSEIHDDSSQPNTLATTKEEGGSDQGIKSEQNLNKEGKVNPDETLNKPPKEEPLNVGNVQVPKEGCKEKSHDENSSKPKSNPTAKGTQTNQGGFPGRGVTFEKQPENKSLKTSGRGRGALKMAANLTGNKGRPGHAVRDEGRSSEFDKAQAASIYKVSKRPIKKKHRD